MSNQKKIIEFFKRKKILIPLSVFFILAVIGGAFFVLRQKKELALPENQPQVYEALVNIVDQKTKDPVEDARSSLKKGDVIAYFPEGHPWSGTEKISYLIVKIKLRPDEAAKLTEAETKEINRDLLKLKENEKNKAEEIGPERETVRARKYRLDLPDFDVQKFWGDHVQPFGDRVFDRRIIDKK
jgi:hypothetical protein